MSGSASDTNNRTIFSIVSSCLATLFACIWISVHPNVPRPSQGNLALSWRRFCLMMVAVIAPEIMAGFAARQFLDARWFSQKYDVSITHGFFFAMGGFVSASGHRPIVHEEQLRARPEYLTAIRSIKAEDIEDKSKGDSLSKGVIVLQGTWFAAQCLARIQQRLPLTGLEVATLAFQSVNIFIWLLWWHKPLNVQQPILLGPADEFMAWTERRHRPRVPGFKPAVAQLVVNVSDSVFVGDCYAFDPVESTAVPLFWSTHGLRVEGPGNGDTRFVSRFIFLEFLVGTVFGLIHCAAWNAHFPSADEKLIWRSCSLVVSTAPLALTLFFIFCVLYSTRKPLASRALVVTLVIAFDITIWAYRAARLLLIALSFTTLRALPPNAFVDVNWSTYIPHL
ncbi:hypothetical protein DFH08DRAFT_948373 [Mycena albidolilacea]|uniref:Uncharacterized protein n=1 Tax=Mycena albidolilacea TaxID=1033008 RepID=A0AAD7AQS7_9AGAR|nr:hypothetical protein DFH08DRAFT_948373 [Mycena albidolilacea]